MTGLLDPEDACGLADVSRHTLEVSIRDHLTKVLAGVVLPSSTAISRMAYTRGDPGVPRRRCPCGTWIEAWIKYSE